MPHWRVKDLACLSIFLGSLFFILLGSRPLFVPDEGRYAEIAREMLTSGDYVTPYLNSMVYFEKPVLFYWLGAAAFKIGGLNLWAIRSVNAILGIIGCLLTYITASQLYGRKTGILAAIILGTNLLYFIMSHMVSLDLTVTVFLSLSLFAFVLGTETPPGIKRRLYIYTAATSAALAVLTKGLIGIVFPVMIIGAWITLLGEWRLLKRLYLPTAILLFFIIATPWHILAQLRHPTFFHFYFIEQHFLRYTDLSIGHYEPIWFFIPYLIIGFAPWIVFLPQAIKFNLPTSWRDRKTNATPLFFLLWITIIFLFFSLSKSKLIPYILPIFPALAIITARYVTRISNRILITITIITSITLITFMSFVPSIDTRTILPLTQILKPLLKPQDEVITYNQYYQDLPFYLERRVSILNWQNEMHFGMQLQNTSEWMIDDAIFWKRWHSKQHVYVIISQNELAQLREKHPNEHIHILGKTLNNVLISNTPIDLLSH